MMQKDQKNNMLYCLRLFAISSSWTINNLFLINPETGDVLYYPENAAWNNIDRKGIIIPLPNYNPSSGNVV